MGIKSHDFFAVYGCSNCHDIIDGRRKTELPREEVIRCQLRALERTWEQMILDGLITIN
jgi:predicted HNH restriction endonuclease